MKMNHSILLVAPSQHARKTLREVDFVRFQPLDLATIATSTPEHWNVEIIDESLESVQSLDHYTIVGVSITTRTAFRAYEIAQKARDCGRYTVAGGIHASMMTDEALRYFDTVIAGEGELPWTIFLEDFERGKPKRLYKTHEFQNMDDLPMPRRSALGYNYQVGSIQTSRGCPFNCTFCSVTAFNGRKYRSRSPELVLKELTTIPQQHVFFVDDNLIGCSKHSFNRAKQIFRGMIDRKLNKTFLAQVTTNFGSDGELVELAARSGCRGVFIGIESIDTNILKSMNKTINLKMSIRRYREMFIQIHDHGIAVIGTIALGSDGEADTVFEDTARFIEESGMDAVQLTIVTPLPGTQLFEQLRNEGRIVFDNYPDDWIHYSLGSLVFLPKDKDPAAVAVGWKRLIDRVFSAPNMLKRSISTFSKTGRLSSTYLSLRLNRAYREAYLHSSFYHDPPLDAFISKTASSAGKPEGIESIVN